MNTALFKASSAIDINNLLKLPFVSDVKIVKSPGAKSAFTMINLILSQKSDELPPFDRPVTMVNGYPLHNSGYDGKGILIAVLDGGFSNADQISSLIDSENAEMELKQLTILLITIIMFMISVIMEQLFFLFLQEILPDNIAGTAPGADYLLLKTEDIVSEFPCEEDFWAAGAEFADSAGADIISSSLGYYNFDDPSLNYKYSDLDGNTAFVTRAADIAASKEFLLLTVQEMKEIKTGNGLSFPADGDSVVGSGCR